MKVEPWRSQFDRQAGWAEVELKFLVHAHQRNSELKQNLREMLGRLVAFPNGQRFVLTRFVEQAAQNLVGREVEIEFRRVPTRLFVAFQEFDGDVSAVLDELESLNASLIPSHPE